MTGHFVGAVLAMTLAAGGAVTVADSASADAGAPSMKAPSTKALGAGLTVKPEPGHPGAKATPPVVDAQALTPEQLVNQVKAADALQVDLMRSGAEVAAANQRLERLDAQANVLLGKLSSARTAQNVASSDAAAQQARLTQLGAQTQSAQDALGQLASDSYIHGGGALGDVVTIIESLTAPSAGQSTDSLATVQYLMDGRARVFDRLRSLRADQVLTSARAEGARTRTAAAARQAAQAKSQLDTVIAQERSALKGFQAAQAAQLGRAAGVRGALLRSEDAAAGAADKRLAQALGGQDLIILIDKTSSCGTDKASASYPNGRLPASALCPLYAAPGESLSHDAARAFNAMSNAYQRDNGSPLCVTSGYRSYAEQAVVKLASPKMAASPGRSQHGLGLAVDLCGGVQDFANPAHLWMQRNAPLFGWFHPAWAEPSGSLPEPWHWEFAS